MEDGDHGGVGAMAEACLEPFDGLGGKGDLGHEDDGAEAAPEGVGDGLEIDLGLAGAGDAVEEEREGDGPGRGWEAVGRGGDGVEGFPDDGEGGGLLGVEGEGLGGDDFLAGVGVAVLDLGGDAGEALVLELADGVGRGVGEAKEFLEGHLAPFLEDVEDLALARAEVGKRANGRDEGHMEAFLPARVLLADGIREDALEGNLDGAAVVAGDPAGEVKDLGGDDPGDADDGVHGAEVGVGRGFGEGGNEAGNEAMAEGDLEAGADLHAVEQGLGDGVVELLADRDLEGDACDHRMAAEGQGEGAGARRVAR